MEDTCLHTYEEFYEEPETPRLCENGYCVRDVPKLSEKYCKECKILIKDREARERRIKITIFKNKHEWGNYSFRVRK